MVLQGNAELTSLSSLCSTTAVTTAVPEGSGQLWTLSCQEAGTLAFSTVHTVSHTWHISPQQRSLPNSHTGKWSCSLPWNTFSDRVLTSLRSWDYLVQISHLKPFLSSWDSWSLTFPIWTGRYNTSPPPWEPFKCLKLATLRPYFFLLQTLKLRQLLQLLSDAIYDFPWTFLPESKSLKGNVYTVAELLSPLSWPNPR